jgi:hypothetical protein
MNHLYVTGSFIDTINLYSYNESSITLNKNNTNSFVSQYDLSGNPIWGSIIGNCNINNICTDNSYVYVTGYFSSQSTLTLYNVSNQPTIVLNNEGDYNNRNILIAKYDLSGNPLWGTIIYGIGDVSSTSICTDNSYVYITGYFTTQLTLNDIVLNGNDNNIFIAKYDLSGNPIWGSVIGSTGNYNNGMSICTDNIYVYITGYFTESITLYKSNNEDIILNNGLGTMNAFIAKYDLSGNPLWASMIGGSIYDQAYGICTDNTSLYITGIIESPTLTLYHYNEPSTIVLNGANNNNNNNNNVFIAKYDLSGNPLWASMIAGTNLLDNGNSGNSICTDNSFVYLTGYFTDPTVTLYHYNEASSIILNNKGDYDITNIFIAKYDLSGNPVWGSVIGGIGNDSATNICTDDHFIYLSGYFTNTLTLYHYNEASTIVLNTDENGSSFVAKYDLNGNPLWASMIGSSNNSMCVTYKPVIIDIPINVPIEPEQCNPKCNTVYNLQQSGISRKKLISQMLRSNTTISYDNSRTASYYMTILSLDYSKNKFLLLTLKYKLYMDYFNKLVSCGKYNSKLLYSMIEYILANLTEEEYNIVYNIKKVIEVITGPLVITIKKTFYVVVDSNKTFFILKNYNGEYFITKETYEFNLEDPSNLGCTFCLSSQQNNIPVSGLTYNGTPGRPGATLLFNVPTNVQYQLYIFNSTSNSNSYSWGYGIPLIPIIGNTIYSTISYTTLQVAPNSILSIYHKNGPKYFITNSDTNFTYINSLNYKYSFYYGTYYLKVPKLYSVALLNNLSKNQIQYTGDIQKSVSSLVKSTTSDGTYNFYYDIIEITVYEPFTPLSLYSYYYGYLGAINTVIFGYGPSKPYNRSDHPFFNGIEQVYSQTKVVLNGTIRLNNNSSLSTSTQYGVYNGTYLFFTEEYITFLTNETDLSTNQKNDKTNLFVVSGTNGIIGPGPDGITNYKFYSGVIQVKILGNFNKLSMYTYNNGYAGGRYLLTYGEQFNNFIPHSYDFTNESNLLLTEQTIQYPTNKIALNTSDVSYNTITTDISGQILFNNIPYDNTGNTVYTMTKGLYIFYAIGPFVAFMTNNKSVTYRGNSSGFYYSTAFAPNAERYIFFTSTDTNAYHAIIVNVTGNFGYLSICTPSGYNGGQNLISFV